MTADSRFCSSAASDPTLLASAVEVLESVEGLPTGSTGALRFEDEGVVLVDGARVCWAIARNMRERLTDILCKDPRRPIARADVEHVFRRAKESGTPLGESLVASGLISVAGLRAALLQHNAEAIACLAHARKRPTQFSSHAGGRYDPRFSFSTTELLAAISRASNPGRAAKAGQCLEEVGVEDAVGVAFVRDVDGASPAVIAVDGGCPLRVGETLEMCGWVNGLFDVTVLFDSRTALISACWHGTTGVVAWRIGDVSYAAICSSRPASALLLNQLASRLHMGGVRYSGTMRTRS
ncbi:MAG TPA: hypothetical protein VGM06_26335 [Polyangiaceae bacterium]|jgi:hypothetical protein